MSQPYGPGYGGGQQPWGAPQQAPGGHPGQQGGYPPQGGHPQQGGYPPQGGYPQGPPPQYPQAPGYPPQPGYGGPPWQPNANPRKGSPAGIGVAIAAALMAVGTFLPWISVKFSLGTTSLGGTPLSSSGFNRHVAGVKAAEGKIVLLCAFVAVGLGIAAMATNGKLGIAAAAPAAVAALVILKVFSDKASYDDKFPTLGSGSSLDVSLSAGIYLSLLMAIAVAGLGVICAVTSKSR